VKEKKAFGGVKVGLHWEIGKFSGLESAYKGAPFGANS
jgi:hypothetical protein